MTAIDRFNLEGQVAVVTGGTRGLGEGFATALTDADAAVMLVGRDTDRGRTVTQTLTDSGATAAFTAADVTVPQDVTRILEETLDRFGRVDILVNNAGACIHAPPSRSPTRTGGLLHR
jgi:NAD(P)-dependent dehydrogenase (short-subunit alcohol dehydrogenase family)